MILPLRVLGSASVKRMSSGRAMAPISCTTCSLSWARSASSAFRPACTVTNATSACPLRSSGRPTTAASATSACDMSALSTSMVPSRWPATLMTSSTRPMIQK